MKRFALSFILLSISTLPALAQEPPAAKPAAVTSDARIQSLEEQVRVLVEQVSQLRAEVRTLRDTKGPDSAGENKVVLASSRIEAGMLPSAPEPAPQPNVGPATPAPAQVTQTQTYGGATSNAKLLNPDIS